MVFGEFELNIERFELRSAGQVVAVQPKVLRLLIYLVEQRGRVVSNEELLSTLWPGETVTEGSVKRAIKSLRRALGERANSPKSIRNVRGQGYQFVAALTPAPSAQRMQANASAHESKALSGFIPRADLDETLDDAWRETELGRGTALLLFGEAGVGKSSALQRLAARAAERGGFVWLGRAADVEGATAYWPFITMLREALQQDGGGQWLSLMGEGAVDLVQALPDLRMWLPAGERAPDIEATSARFRFFDSMLTFLRRACQRAPMLIIVDDLPQADAPTIQLFAFLARHASGGRLLLAAAMRQSARTRTEVEASLELDAASRHAQHVHVRGFSRDEVARFIEAQLGAPVDTELVEQLTEQTAGNPLLLGQLVHVCRPILRGDTPRWEALETLVGNRGLQSATERLVSELSAPARDFLQTAALLGRRFSRVLLAELLEASAEDVITWLQETSAAGLTVGANDPSEQSSFTHGLVRDELARVHTVHRRRQLHERAAELLAERHARGAAEPSEVAYHYLQAGCYEHALHFSLLAARAATTRLAASAALPHYAHALAALDHMPNDPAKLAEVLLEKANAQRDAGELGEARATYMQVIRLARTLEDKTTLARAALGLDAPAPNDLDPEALKLLQEALAALRPTDALYPLVTAAVAKALCMSRDVPQRNRAIERALQAARAEGDPLRRARALCMCHEAMGEPHHLAERVKICPEVSEIARAHSDMQLCIDVAKRALYDAVELGDMQSVESSLAFIEQLAEQVREPIARWHAKMYRSMSAFVEGRMDVALQCAQQAYELGSRYNESAARHGYLVQMAGPCRMGGQLERARELVYEASARRPEMAGWRCAVAQAEFDVGNYDAARKLFDELFVEGLPALTQDAFLLSVLCPLSELCAWLGDRERAAQLYEALLPYAGRCGTIAYGIMTYGPVSRYLGGMAAACQKYDLAETHFRESELESRRMRSPSFLAVNAVSHATAMLREPCTPAQRNRALAQIPIARELARKHGFGSVLLVCDALAAHTGDETHDVEVQA